MASGYVVNHQDEARAQARKTPLWTDGENTGVNPHFLRGWYVYRAFQLCFWGGILFLIGTNFDSLSGVTWSVRSEKALGITAVVLYIVAALVLWSTPDYKQRFTRRCIRAHNAGLRGGWFRDLRVLKTMCPVVFWTFVGIFVFFLGMALGGRRDRRL
jgi:hypothetical protein